MSTLESISLININDEFSQPLNNSDSINNLLINNDYQCYSYDMLSKNVQLMNWHNRNEYNIRLKDKKDKNWFRMKLQQWFAINNVKYWIMKDMNSIIDSTDQQNVINNLLWKERMERMELKRVNLQRNEELLLNERNLMNDITL